MIIRSSKYIYNRIIRNFDDKDFLELFSKGGLALLFRVGGQLLGFLLTFVIAKICGADTLGDYVLAIVILKVFTLISKLGLDTGSIKYIAAYAAERRYRSITLFRKKSVTLITVMSVLCSFIMYFGSDYIAQFITVESDHIKITSFFVLPMSIFIFHYQNMRGLKFIGGYSFFFWMSQSLFSLITILILTKYINVECVDAPLYAYLISLIIVSILSVLVFTYFFREKFKVSEDTLINSDTDSIKDILRVSLPLMLAQAVHFIMSWTDKIMLNILYSPDVTTEFTNSAQVGVYHTAFRLSMFATIGLMAFKSIASPKFAELYKKNDIKLLKKVTQQSTKLIFWTTLPLVIIFVIFSDFLMGLFGEEFEKGVFAFIILSIGRVVVSFSGAAGNLLQMCGRQVVFMNVAIIGSIINIVLNFTLIPIYGINGSAIATMLSLIVFNFLLVYFVKREFGFYTFYIPFLKSNKL